MNKSDLIAMMREKQKGISEGLSPREYVFRCVEAMFDVAAEVLAIKPDHAGDAEAIREAIDAGGGQSCDVEGVLRELEKAGFAIVRASQIERGPK